MYLHKLIDDIKLNEKPPDSKGRDDSSFKNAFADDSININDYFDSKCNKIQMVLYI